MNILVTPSSEPLFLQRSLWSIARNGSRTSWRIVVSSHREDDLAILKRFSCSFNWTFLLLGEGRLNQAEVLPHVQGERFFLLDGNTIAWTNPSYRQQTPDEVQKKVPPTILFDKKNSAFDLLLSEPEADVVHASVYQLPVGAVMDDYGAALHPRLVDYCYRAPLDGRIDCLALVRRKFFGEVCANDMAIGRVTQSERAVALHHPTNERESFGKLAPILSVTNSKR